MASLFPNDLESFRSWLSQFDYLQASDLQTAFEAVLAIENELGILPGGTQGSVVGRLFAHGNISERWAAWNRLRWETVSTQSLLFARQNQGMAYTWPDQIMKGQDTVFGEDTPAVFGQLQWPLQSGQGGQSRGGAPWRSFLGRVQKTSASFYALDGESEETNQFSMVPVQFGVLVWNLIT